MNEYTEQSYKEIAYKAIKDKIISCELMPGAVVDKRKLMKDIGVGLTPIREALSNLEQEDLVVIMPRRGVVVSNISINDISEIYSVRELIEPYLAKAATPNVEETELRKYAEMFETYDGTNKLEETYIDSNFHRYIAEKTLNKYLIKLMDNIYSQNQRIRILTASLPRRLEESRREHLNIIDMFIKRDEEGVEKAMREHIAKAKIAASQII